MEFEQFLKNGGGRDGVGQGAMGPNRIDAQSPREHRQRIAPAAEHSPRDANGVENGNRAQAFFHVVLARRNSAWRKERSKRMLWPRMAVPWSMPINTSSWS